ncbi:MAG TPA: peroxide stress protein YaaA [Glycomyces sp.]|nr:peroxide stress protein YaaA [Glycomyces sp.]
MLILLPPSEGKAVQGDGPPLDLGRLSSPALNPVREALVDRLVDLCADEDAAVKALKLPASARHYVQADRALRTAPTLAAWELYNGVLYDRLGLGDLPDGEQVFIASPLWGLLRPSDRVPPYRMPMSTKFPGLDGLAKLWRPAVSEVLGARNELIVDLRSGAYSQVWSPKDRGVSVRVFKEDADGKRTIVTHMAKATRGEVARALLAGGARLESATDLGDFLSAQGLKVELSKPATRTKPWLLDIVSA